MAFTKSFLKPPLTFPSVSGDVCSFVDKLGGFPLKAHEVSLVAKQAAGTPSPSSPLPISGWDAINIRKTGKNVWGGIDLATDFDGKANNYSLDTANKVFTYGRAISSPYQTPLFDRFKPNTVYTVIWTCRRQSASGSNDSLRIRYTDNTTEGILCSSDTKQTVIVTTNSNKSVKDIYIGYNSTATTECYYDESGVFEGTLSADDFVAYNGQSVTIQIGSTIYGGTFDAITGILTVTHEGVDMGTLAWQSYTFSGVLIFYALANGKKGGSPSIHVTGKCEVFDIVETEIAQNLIPEYNIMLGNGSQYVYVNDPDYSDYSSFKTAMNGKYLVYELATPQEIQLSPAQILTLKNNNIWADTGATSLQYIKIGR